MLLQKRILMIIFITIIFLVSVLYIMARTILLSSFNSLEEDNAQVNIQRTLSSINNDVSNLSMITEDWAVWDDTYEFIEDGNTEYIEANLADVTLTDLDINYLIFINSSRQIIYSRGIDASNGNEPIPIPDSLLEHFSENDLLINHTEPTSAVQGFVKLPEGVLLLASLPILPSFVEAPIRGSLIMGRLIDSQEVEELAQRTSQSLSLLPIDDPQISPDMNLAKDNLTGGETMYIRPLDADKIAGYAMINDIYGNPALLLRIEATRDIYKHGEIALSYFAFSLFSIGTICLLVIMLLLKRLVLSRLKHISASLTVIGSESDLSARLPLTGEDEFTSLAVTINGTMASLEQKQQKLKENEERFRALAENAQDVIYRFRFRPSRGYEYISPSVIRISGYTPEEFYADPEMAAKIAFPDDCQDMLEYFNYHPGKEGLQVLRWVHKNGTVVFAEHRNVAFYDEENNLQAIEGIGRDITMRKLAEDQMRHCSLHDSLTGIYNRTYFEYDMHRIGNDRKYPVGIVVCDVDGLKLVNDTLGHDKGDSLLIAAAEVLKSTFRESDMVARIGGDEFAVLLTESSEDIIKDACSRIKAKIEKYNSSNPELPLSMSTGFAIKTDPETSMDKIFKEADNCMYREKMYCAQSGRSAIVKTLKKALEARDFITEGHAERLLDLVTGLARAISLPESKIFDLRLLAQFHDIGKVGTPDRILFKNGPLTAEEKIEMQQHSEIGHRIAMSAPDLAPVAGFILKHHEWWNGKGYPLKLKGENIPLECRILALADAYDAMTSDRPYRKAMPHEDAINEIRKCAGVQFDPELASVFIRSLGPNMKAVV